MKNFLRRLNDKQPTRAILGVAFLALLLWGVSVSFDTPTYATSVPASDFQEDQFVMKWVCLEPISGGDDRESLRAAFDDEALSSKEIIESVESGYADIDGNRYSWVDASSASSHINFIAKFGEIRNSYTYAVAEIESLEAREFILGVGSDDAIKLWLNGELIHENWTFRGVRNDQDLVAANLLEGKNQLVAKVVNAGGGWGLSLRPLLPETAKLSFGNAVATMDLESLDRLLKIGFDIDVKSDEGFTALQSAVLDGLDVRAKQLIERGADPRIDLPRFESVIRGIFENAVNPDLSGVAYLVSQDGKIIAKGGLGLADMENKVPITTETKFRIGSVSKQFTAFAILLLQERGKLSVDDPLSKYIPDFPRGDEVTIRQLLNHTSGIHSYTSMPDFMSRVTSPIEAADLISEIKEYEYDFEPGEQWTYNNSGYFILGDIVERVSGKPLGEFWKDNFFDPLEMRNTGAYANGSEYENEALGYSNDDGATSRAMDWDMSWAGGAGNIYSTVEDLYIWNEALFNGKILEPESFNEAVTPAKLANGEVAGRMGSQYGLGLMIGEVRGSRIIQHGGGLHGFLSMLTRLPEKNLTIITLSNSMPTNLRFQGNPYNRIASLAIGMDDVAALKQSPEVETALNLEDYVGRYDYGRAVNTVTHEDGRLYVQLTGQRKFEIFHSSGDNFYLKAVQAEAAFERDEAGHVVGLRHTQNGRSFEAPKLAPIKEIEVDPSVFAKFVGDYQLQPNFIISITHDEDALWAQATGQSRFQIYPTSKNEYVAKVANIRIVFNSAEDDSIESFSLHQGGQVMKAKRLE